MTCRHCHEAIDLNLGAEEGQAKFLHIEDHEDEGREYDHDPEPPNTASQATQPR